MFLEDGVPSIVDSNMLFVDKVDSSEEQLVDWEFSG